MKIDITLPHHSYTIVFKQHALDSFADWVHENWPLSKKIGIVSDSEVSRHYLEPIMTALTVKGYTCRSFVFPSGEENKSPENALNLLTFLASESFSKHDGLIALGGGVVGDLTGFVASIYMRGIDWLQVPTTLLAQVDSSVGGKTAINLPSAKNIVGSFYQPNGVWIDTMFLETLPQRQLASGMAEVIKIAALMDVSLWRKLEKSCLDTATSTDFTHWIYRSCQLKAQIVEQDEKDTGIRHLLNFGHTFGHALEQVTHYEKYFHGEAVAIGMMLILSLQTSSEQTRVLETRMRQVLQQFHLPVTLPDEIDSVALWQALKLDKKRHGQEIKWVALETIGNGQILTDTLTDFYSKFIKSIGEN